MGVKSAQWMPEGELRGLQLQRGKVVGVRRSAHWCEGEDEGEKTNEGRTWDPYEAKQGETKKTDKFCNRRI